MAGVAAMVLTMQFSSCDKLPGPFDPFDDAE
jgi:hypothetical protein